MTRIVTVLFILLCALNSSWSYNPRRVAQSAVKNRSIQKLTISGDEYLLWDNYDIDGTGHGILSVELAGKPDGLRLANEADDFTVMDGVRWSIDEVYVRGFIGTGTSDPDYYGIIIYRDDNGKPGSLLKRMSVSSVTKSYDDIRMPLPESISLESGNYWFSVCAGYSGAVDLANTRWYWMTGPAYNNNPGFGQDQTGTLGGYSWLSASFDLTPEYFDGVFAIIGKIIPLSKSFYPDFTPDRQSGYAPLTVNFQNYTLFDPSCPIQQYWYFSEDAQDPQSFDLNPQWTYHSPGFFRPSLVVSNEYKTLETFLGKQIEVFQGESALYFNGSTGLSPAFAYAQAKPDINLREVFTFEAWIYPEGWGPRWDNGLDSGFGRIFDKYAFGLFIHNDGDYGYAPNSLVLTLSYDDETFTDIYTGANTIAVNEWQHVAAIYDGNNKKVAIYINGNLQKCSSIGDPLGGILMNNVNDSFFLGNRDDLYRAFDGSLDEIRLWNRVLTQQDIQQNMHRHLVGSEPGLIGYWQLNEGNGNAGKDLSGKSHNLAIESCDWTQGLILQDGAQVDAANNSIIDKMVVGQNYPNPFNLATNIEFEITQRANVKIDIMDILGRTVKLIMDEKKMPGHFTVRWAGTDDRNETVPSGIYFYRLSITTESGGKYDLMKKMIMVK